MRFLALTLGGWTMLRVALLWPTIDSVPAVIRAIAPPVAAAPLPPVIVNGRAARPASPIIAIPATIAKAPIPPLSHSRDAGAIVVARARTAGAFPAQPASTPVQSPPPRLAPLAAPPDRLAGSFWGIARGGARGTITGSQLGGSQVGARLTYALGSARRVALAARVSAPLRGQGAEIGLGIDWQPTRHPLHVSAEQRIAIDGGRGGPTLLVVGGVDPRPLALGFRVEAYGQAGVIARRSVEGFADAAARLVHSVARSEAVRLDLGVGAWGGAQKGAARLDIGPSLAVSLPVERRTVRVTLDWRRRIAGNAHPGSGPALSIGSDF